MFDGLHFPQSDSYLFREGADKLCRLYYGLPYDQVLSGVLPDRALDCQASEYRVAEKVALETVRMRERWRRGEFIWTCLDIAVESFDFWQGAIRSVRDQVKSGAVVSGAVNLGDDHQLIEALALKFWQTVLRDRFQRCTEARVGEDFYIIRIDNINRLERTSHDFLDFYSITISETERLSDPYIWQELG